VQTRKANFYVNSLTTLSGKRTISDALLLYPGLGLAPVGT